MNTQKLIRLLRQVEDVAAMMEKRDGPDTFILQERPGISMDDFVSWASLKRDAANERIFLEKQGLVR